jgi:DNA-binding XRE family transcriptional regulator
MLEQIPEIVDDNVPSLATRLKAVRADRQITQAQAARELDVARTAYRLWEMEAAKPAPDRWRLLARWLGVSMSTLLLVEGLITEEERAAADGAADRFEAATRQSADAIAEAGHGSFFEQAQVLIDSSLANGLITATEAEGFAAMMHRVRAREDRPQPDAADAQKVTDP